MDTLRTIKGLIARLAGAPLGPGSGPGGGRAGSPTARQRDGGEGEAFARRYLERAGLRFVAANVAYRDGEIDLVMRDAASATLVFVEVRRRSRDSHGGAAASITPEKRRRVAAAAAHYLSALGVRTLPACRFDVVTLDGDRDRGIDVEWILDAFGDHARR